MTRFESTEQTTISTSAATSPFHAELATLLQGNRYGTEKKDFAGLSEIMLVKTGDKENEQATTPGQLIEDANKAWDNASNRKDLKQAYAEITPKFEAAINGADAAYNKAAPIVLEKLAKLQPDLEKHQKAENAAYSAAGEALKNLPKGDFEKFNKWAIEYIKLDENKRTKDGIAERFAQIPGLKEAADNLEKAQRAKMAVYGQSEQDPAVVKANNTLKEAEKSIQDIVKKLPAHEQNGAMISVEKYTHIDPRFDVDRHQFVKFMLSVKPGLVQTLDDIRAVAKAAEPVRARAHEHKSEMSQLLNDQVDARRSHRNAVHQIGDAAKREELQKQIDTIRIECRKYEK